MKSINLSKSQFIRGLQCHKSLWLYKNQPELRTQADQSKQALYDSGTDVGVLAQGLFPGGEVIQFEGSTFDEKINKTKELINSGVDTIYEATFKFYNILVMVDILHKGSDGWQIYEVKASTGVKEVHENDVSLQYYVLTGSGLEVSSASLVHINNQYVRHGNLEINKLFTIADITETAMEKQGFIQEELEAIRSSIKGDCPKLDIGPHCSDPYGCDFTDHCWSHIPNYSIFNLSRLYTNKKFELYYKGILSFEDIPIDYPLSQSQRHQVEAELSGNEIINVEGINEFLDQISYPLYFLDFETYQQAIPQFNNLRPYEQIPFQYSLHYIESENGELKHSEFLGKEGADPRKELAQGLVDSIPNNACIVTYNASFEKRIIGELAEHFSEFATRLTGIRDNIIDLMVPFQNKHLYKKEMKGSYSIKYVLPALVPELSYKDLEISGGGQASETYAKLHLNEDKNKIDEIRENLLEYCKLDTLAMVKILEVLEGQV
jgi:hypothetical protein